MSHWLEPQENHSRAPLGLSFLICTDHSNTLPFTIYSFGRCLWNASMSQARAGCKGRWTMASQNTPVLALMGCSRQAVLPWVTPPMEHID